MRESSLKDRLIETQLWKSVFRHRHTDSEPSRIRRITGNVFLHLHPATILEKDIRFWPTMCLGGLSFGLFLVLVVTGVLLMFYYRPSVSEAYGDMKDLQFVVTSGMFLRNLHRWAAHGMVITVILHMARVFYAGAYRPPREFNWVVGVALLILTLLLSYTGYLLPWDQLAFWAITVGTNMADAAPVIGPRVKFMLLGGKEVGGNALIRFYVLHCAALPLVAVVFLAVHFWRVRKDQVIEPL